MTDDPKLEEVSPSSSGKTYSLVEIVHGPTTMVDKWPEDTVFAFPIVAMLELLLAVGMTVVLMVFSMIKDAPLEELANPIITTDPAKAPWYFIGLQEMLEHMHPTLAGVAIPVTLVLFLVAIPYIDNDREGSGRWFTSPRGKQLVLRTAIYAVVVMPVFVLLSNTFPPRELLRDVLPPVITQAVIPGTVLFAISFLPALVVWRFQPRKTNAREILLVLFTMLIVSAMVLTIIGFAFRGPGFKLFWPWNMPDGYNPLNNL